eukprot:2004464-Prymnesium_polylepis.2
MTLSPLAPVHCRSCATTEYSEYGGKTSLSDETGRRANCRARRARTAPHHGHCRSGRDERR